MNKITTRLTALILLLCCSLAQAQPVTAVGVGTTPSEAERDAMRCAVQQAVGTLLDANTITRNAQIIEDNIYTTSHGYIANYTVTKRQQTDGVWRITINADISTDPSSALMDKLTRLGIIQHSLRNAKIAVLIPEQHLTRQLLDPAGETAVIKTLLEAGFANIIDISQTRLDHNIITRAATTEQMKNIADSLQADILITGEAFSERGDRLPYMDGLTSCQARVEAKMYIVRTGQIIAADGTYGQAVHNTEAIAAKRALAQAGEKMGRYLSEQLLGYGSGSHQQIEMIVLAADIDQVNALKSELMRLSGVTDVKFTRWETGRATLAIRYSGAPETLFSRLSQTSDYTLEAVEITYNTLTVRI